MICIRYPTLLKQKYNRQASHDTCLCVYLIACTAAVCGCIQLPRKAGLPHGEHNGKRQASKEACRFSVQQGNPNMSPFAADSFLQFRKRDGFCALLAVEGDCRFIIAGENRADEGVDEHLAMAFLPHVRLHLHPFKEVLRYNVGDAVRHNYIAVSTPRNSAGYGVCAPRCRRPFSALACR